MLEKIDVKAMRSADTVVLQSDFDTHEVVCVKKGGPWEQEHRIAVEGFLNDFQHTPPARSGVVVIQSAQFTPEWLTVAQIARAGDTLRLVWTRNNWSQVTRDAGVFRDELAVEIARPLKRKVKVFRFTIEVSINPGNSARMIKGG